MGEEPANSSGALFRAQAAQQGRNSLHRSSTAGRAGTAAHAQHQTDAFHLMGDSSSNVTKRYQEKCIEKHHIFSPKAQRHQTVISEYLLQQQTLRPEYQK